ncbi:CAP domain-containing protein [Melghirimyces algeriensis]|uniref:Uncharacterized protein, YkwD family n=1 Tax=Melghirimyces algeriensis TaxID=910412 RepID=A0A521F0P2_9BACL|nr:CAP domain-containing protein [Melghirimyces algeriensis]SMO89745.1 uncharacterized protein, YkwD family [Melghirimyces algeriensis]
MKTRITIVFLTVALFLGLVSPAYAYPLNYTVRSGDTLYQIARYHGVSLTDMIHTNPQISNPDIIYKGQSVYVPDRFASQVNIRVTWERSKRGLAPLKMDRELSRVAFHKAIDMANRGYFSHHSPTYGSPFTMMRNYGIQFTQAGENIAKGQRTPKDVMSGWMNSAGHRKNILNPAFNTIGIGYYKGHWVQMFIRK